MTIPKRIRDQFGLAEGEQIQFVVTEEGELTIRRKRGPMERLRDVREQLAPLGVDVDELRRQAKKEWRTVDGDAR